MNSNFYVLAEDDIKDFIKVPTKLLFNNYDRKLTTILISDKGCYDVLPFNYSYAASDDYRYSCFRYNKDYHPLSVFQRKLLSVMHHEWFNPLKPILDSSEFLTLLKHIAKIRTERNVKPSKDDMFKFLLNRIENTEIPQSLIENEEIGKGFLNYCKKLKEERVLTKKKFDY